MRVLLTNDDGITAPGLQAARRALRELDGVEVDVIAPDSNRSATGPQHHDPLAADASRRSSSATATSATRPTARRSTASASPSWAWSAAAPT